MQFLVCSTKNESALRISLPGIIHVHALHQRVANDSRTRFSRCRLIWLLPHPLLPSVSLTGDTEEDLEKIDNLPTKGGEWKGPNHTAARKLGPQ
jgi:hypothetical protein